MRIRDLPDGWRICVDTETSGDHVDSGGRIAIVSFAFRHPTEGHVVAKAIPFDQGIHELPLGEKEIPKRHLNRIKRWPEELQQEVAPNLPPDRYPELIEQLSRLNITYHGKKFDEQMELAGLRGPEQFQEIYPQTADMLRQAGGWCTLVGSNVIDPRYPLALKATAVRMGLTGGEEDAAEEALKPFLGPRQGVNADPRYDLVPWSVIGPYAAEDAVLGLLLCEHQERFLVDENNIWYRRYFLNDLAVCTTLINMEQRGIGFDVPLCNEQAAKLKKEMKRLAEILPFKGGTGGPTSPAAKKYFFDDQNRPPYPGKITETGQPQLDTEVQENLIREGVRFAQEYHDHEKAKSALSKWYVGWAEKCGEDGRLRCNFDQTNVITGRLAGKRANLVAIPHTHQLPRVEGLVPVRELFVPKPGCELWEVDVSQADVRVGAMIAECKALLNGFLNGVDAHTQVSHTIFGDAEPRHRRIAKTLNLALQYWAGPKKVRAQLEKDTGEKWTLAAAKEIWMAWHDQLPEMELAMQGAKHEAETLGYVKLWNGRIRWFEHFRNGQFDPTFTAFNGKVQGGVAEIMKLVMVAWDRKYPGTLLIQTHDALLLELPIEEAENLAEECAKLMCQIFEKCLTWTWRSTGKLITMPCEADIKKYNSR